MRHGIQANKYCVELEVHVLVDFKYHRLKSKCTASTQQAAFLNFRAEVLDKLADILRSERYAGNGHKGHRGDSDDADSTLPPAYSETKKELR